MWIGEIVNRKYKFFVSIEEEKEEECNEDKLKDEEIK